VFIPGSTDVGFVVDKVALGQVFLRLLLFSRQYHSTMALYTHTWGMNNRHVGGRSSERCHFIDMNMNNNINMNLLDLTVLTSPDEDDCLLGSCAL
jgi:hypothetical protein